MSIDIDKDVRRDGVVSTMMRRLLNAEEWIRAHKARMHQVDADLYGGKTPPFWVSLETFNWSVAKTVGHDAAQNYAFTVFQNAPANGQYGEVGIFFPVATSFTVTVLGYTIGGCGKLDWTLDGVSVGGSGVGQDWYSAAAVYNVFKTFSMSIPTIGYHKLRFTVNGKNALATNYYAILTAVYGVPASY